MGNIQVKIAIIFGFDIVILLSVIFFKEKLKVEPNRLQKSYFMGAINIFYYLYKISKLGIT